MFADMKSMVMKARHEHYALLAINCMNLESAHAAIRVAEKNRAPIILNLYQGHLAHFPAPVAAAVVKTLAESASVPVALALDHGKNPDCIRQAFRAGFSGLMIDASAFPRRKTCARPGRWWNSPPACSSAWKANWAIWQMRRVTTSRQCRPDDATH